MHRIRPSSLGADPRTCSECRRLFTILRRVQTELVWRISALIMGQPTFARTLHPINMHFIGSQSTCPHGVVL